MQFGGPLITDRTKGYDFSLFARFKDRAALDTYAANDEHRWAIDNVIRPHTDIEDSRRCMVKPSWALNCKRSTVYKTINQDLMEGFLHELSL
ncbi:Dabb domain-containing protein [Rhizoctonia solani AG-1 IA]|uniref:Dabb domain-containing protein n=1 Tax=Thanatephorus cucumeris (strain AG1-IA) TaxID=983506 RepID=L8WGG7_THACA|nr:Dabb domain-containing protein [Rhizoctonia solani AG-1 IA]